MGQVFRGQPADCAPTLRRVALVADGVGTWAAPGVVLHEGSTVIAAGSPQVVSAPADATVIDDPTGVVVPGAVNAHCHLDLTHMGAAMPYPGAFVPWIDEVRAARLDDDAAVGDSVREGVALALAGGTAAIGDIAGAARASGTSPAADALRASALSGVAFVELFGRGQGATRAVQLIRDASPDDCPGRMRLGWQPHAPYSCAVEVFLEAARSGRPVATHLAETKEELEFVARGTGAFADLLRRLGVETGAISGHGVHPVTLLAEALRSAPWVIAHLNHLDGLDDEALERLASWNPTVVFCPRAHAYFRHTDHPYRRLRAAGVRVALGTDGLPCLDTPDRIGVLDDARLLSARDGVAARDLLEMMTVEGATALGLERTAFTLRPGPTRGLLRLEAGEADGRDPLVRALSRDDAPSWIAAP